MLLVYVQFLSMIENVCVNFKAIVLMGSLGMLLHGCASVGKIGSESWGNYDSAEELIDKKNLNDSNGRAKDYVYAWGRKQGNAEPQSLYPRKYLSNYCSAQKGSFSLLYKSNLSLVKDSRARNTLAANANVKQGIGAYQCVQNNGKRWIVSIEPVSESGSEQYAGAREVALKTDVMSAEEARKFYKSSSTVAQNSAAKKSAPAAPVKNTAAAKTAVKEVEEKKEAPAAEPVKSAAVALTPQQQQMKLYADARRDINSGKNVNNACNNAQLAYNYGKLQGTEGTRVYTESGMLVARCLTSTSYSRRFPNAKAQAQRVLQNLATNYNHAGAKRMLKQIK